MIQRCYNPRAFANVVSKGAENTHLTRAHTHTLTHTRTHFRFFCVISPYSLKANMPIMIEKWTILISLYRGQLILQANTCTPWLKGPQLKQLEDITDIATKGVDGLCHWGSGWHNPTQDDRTQCISYHRIIHKSQVCREHSIVADRPRLITNIYTSD